MELLPRLHLARPAALAHQASSGSVRRAASLPNATESRRGVALSLGRTGGVTEDHAPSRCATSAIYSLKYTLRDRKGQRARSMVLPSDVATPPAPPTGLTFSEHIKLVTNQQTDKSLELLKRLRRCHSKAERERLTHDLRVSLRRLRTILTVLESERIAKMPKGVEVKQLSKAIRALGVARDVDVQIETLQALLRESEWYGYCKAERKLRQRHLRRLQRRRSKFSKLCLGVAATKGKGSLRSVLAAVSKWTTKAGPFKTVSKEAKAKALRACSEHASHSLSRQIGALFLHPGWSSGAELLKEMRAEDGDTCKVASPSSSHSVELHSLRKALRELRYQMELFEPVYCAEFHPDIMFKDKVGAITKLQGALGDIHDLDVVLEALGTDLERMHTLHHFVVNRQALLLSTWEDLRHHVLHVDAQRSLYFSVLGLPFNPQGRQEPSQSGAATLQELKRASLEATSAAKTPAGHAKAAHTLSTPPASAATRAPSTIATPVRGTSTPSRTMVTSGRLSRRKSMARANKSKKHSARS